MAFLQRNEEESQGWSWKGSLKEEQHLLGHRDVCCPRHVTQQRAAGLVGLPEVTHSFFTTDFQFGGLVPQTAFPKGYAVSYIDVWAVLGEKLTMRTTLPTQESLSHICNLVERVEITHLTAPGVTAKAFWEM